MKHFLWHDGRLGWGFVGMALFSTVWFLLFDVAWRLVEMPFARLAGAFGLGGLVAGGLLLLLWRRRRA